MSADSRSKMPANLRINQKVEIEKLSAEPRETYSSYIAAMEEETLSLAAPLAAGRLVYFAKSEPVRIYTEGVTFVSEVLERVVLPHPLLIIRRPQVVEKMQRRRFVRLEDNVPLRVRVLKPKSGSGAEVLEEFKAETRNVSGGGALFILPRPLSPGTWLEVDLFLPEKLTCRAQVRRVTVLPETHMVQVGVEFMDLPQRDQDRIIKYIFRRQRELRQKGLL